jgi:hypothetical protein
MKAKAKARLGFGFGKPNDRSTCACMYMYPAESLGCPRLQETHSEYCVVANEWSRYKYIRILDTNPPNAQIHQPQSSSLAFVIYNALLLVQHRLLDCWLRPASSTDLDLPVGRRRLVGVDAGCGWLRGACDATRMRFGSSGIRCRNRLLGWSSCRRSCRSHDRFLCGRHSRSPSVVLGCRSRESLLARPGCA